jgi:hypothetical protein
MNGRTDDAIGGPTANYPLDFAEMMALRNHHMTVGLQQIGQMMQAGVIPAAEFADVLDEAYAHFAEAGDLIDASEEVMPEDIREALAMKAEAAENPQPEGDSQIVRPSLVLPE